MGMLLQQPIYDTLRVYGVMFALDNYICLEASLFMRNYFYLHTL